MKKQLWYLSFVDKTGFLGACVVEAKDWDQAIETSWKLKINPGGEVMMIKVPDDARDKYPLNKLMSRAELETYGPVRRKGDMENPPQEIGLN